MNDQMRVALFSGNYNYQADGANKALNKLVDYLERQGMQVLVYSPTSKTPAFEPAGTLISVPSFPVPLRGEYRIGLGLSRKQKQDIRAFDPTLIHLSSPDILGHSALKFSETLGVPAVASFHTRFDTYFKYYKMGWVESYTRRKMAQFYNRCQHVYVPSPSVGDVLVSDGILNGNGHIWSRGIERHRFSPEFRDDEWRRTFGIKKEDIVLSFVGRLVREKGLDIYASIIDALIAQGLPVKALIVGEGPEQGTVRRRLPSAIMTGHISGTELARAYACSDVFINPSATETFGNVTLEAMASGTPTICLNATGSSDLVENGITGWLIDGLETKDWTSKIKPLCQDETVRKTMGRKARQASKAYDWDQIMQALTQNYSKACVEYENSHRVMLQ